MSTFEPPTEGELVGPPPALVAHGKTATMGYLSEKSQADRVSAAREMWTRGILDPAAPGVIYWPSLSEISRMTELTKTTLERHRNADEWDEDRDRNMAAMQVSHMTTVEVSEKAVERSERLQEHMRKLDDRAFELGQQGMVVAGGMLQNMIDTEDQNAGKLQKIASALETFHRVARSAYAPQAETGPTVNIQSLNLNTITASEELVSKVAQVYVDLEEKSRAKANRRVITGELEPEL